MPSVFWKNCENDRISKTDGWRLDFIRYFEQKLVILDAKYYSVNWNDGKIEGQPGIPDIAKQMFYQMAFKDLFDNSNNTITGFVNAFLFPYNGDNITISETVTLGFDENNAASAFSDIHLFAVRISGISLLEKYGNFEYADDWFEKIVNFTAIPPHPPN